MKKRSKKFNISNKLAYTLIAIFTFVLIGVGVYAYGGTAPAVMGHSLGELQGCTSAGQTLNWTGTAWACVTPSDARLSVTTGGLCYYASSGTCTLTEESCYLANLYYEDYGSVCSAVSQTQLNSFCLTRCNNVHSPACDGTLTSCSGGTTFGFTSAIGNCEELNRVSCRCMSTGTYVQEHYSPAGTRCI